MAGGIGGEAEKLSGPFMVQAVSNQTFWSRDLGQVLTDKTRTAPRTCGGPGVEEAADCGGNVHGTSSSRS